MRDIPFDGKPRHSGLLCQDVPLHLLYDWLAWRLCIQCFVCVLVVNIVADADELASIIAAGEEDDGNAQDFGAGQTGEIGRVSFEEEFVGAHRNGSNKE